MDYIDRRMKFVDKASPKVLWCFIIFATMKQCTLLIFGAMVLHNGNELTSFENTPTNVQYQIRADWDTVPFVDVTITTEWICPDGSTEIFSRPWYGIQGACDCTGLSCSDGEDGTDDGSGQMNLGQECKREWRNCGCVEVEGWPLIWQSQF